MSCSPCNKYGDGIEYPIKSPLVLLTGTPSPTGVKTRISAMPEQLSEKNRQRVSIDSTINDWVAILNEACLPAIEAKQYIADYESGRFSEQELKLTLHSLLSSQNLGVYSQLDELSI